MHGGAGRFLLLGDVEAEEAVVGVWPCLAVINSLNIAVRRISTLQQHQIKQSILLHA